MDPKSHLSLPIVCELFETKGMQSRGTRTGIDLGLDRRYIELWQRHPIRKGSVEDNAAAAGRSILPAEQDPARDYKVRVDLTHLGLHPVIAILVQQIIGRPFYRDHFNPIKTTTDTVLFDCYIFFRDDPDIGRF